MTLTQLIQGLRDKARKLDDPNTAQWLEQAANALAAHKRPAGRPANPYARQLSATQADRSHLQASVERLRAERDAHSAELARCVRRLRASGKAPTAVMEDLEALAATMDASTNHRPTNVARKAAR